MKKSYIINGNSGSGKDTFIHFFKELRPSLMVYNISSITLIREITKSITKDKKGIKERNLWAGLKQLLIEYNDTPLKYCLFSYEKIKEGIVFFHIREPKEMHKLILSLPNTKTILIDNDEDSIVESDKHVYDYNYHYYINNTKRLSDLKKETERFIKNEKL